MTEPRSWIGRFTADELSNADYHAAPGVSKTHLDLIATKSPRHYWQKYLNPDRPAVEPTDALRVGNAIHCAILQPDLFESEYAAKPECDRRTREGKALYAEFLQRKGNRTELSPLEYEWCIEMRDSVQRHAKARGLLRGGVPEQSFFVNEPETGELIKCRPDYFHNDGDLVVDFKSAIDAHWDRFGKDAFKYRYDVAVPWYCDIIKMVTGHMPRNWVWIAVEKEPPYAVGIYFAQKHDVIRARDVARQNFLEIIRQRRLGTWVDYADEVRPLVFPGWAKR